MCVPKHVRCDEPTHKCSYTYTYTHTHTHTYILGDNTSQVTACKTEEKKWL